MSSTDIGRLSEKQLARLDWWIKNYGWIAGLVAVIAFAIVVAMPE